MKTTIKWLKELGATRPMQAAADCIYVLGEWREGYYPIMYQFCRRPEIEEWSIFGVMVDGQMTREDCERILRSVK